MFVAKGCLSSRTLCCCQRDSVKKTQMQLPWISQLLLLPMRKKQFFPSSSLLLIHSLCLSLYFLPSFFLWACLMVAVEKIMMPRESCHSALSSSLALLEQDMGITYFYFFAITFHVTFFPLMLFFVCAFPKQLGGDEPASGKWHVAACFKQVTFLNNTMWKKKI